MTSPVSKQESLRLVRVIYIDEAGSSPQEPVFTWAAIVVKDRQWLKIEKLALDIIDTMVPRELRDNFEFHACDLFTGAGVWDRWRHATGKALRFAILESFLRLIRRYRLPIVECSWNKNGQYGRDISKLRQGLAFAVCVDWVERWFVNHARYDVGMLIADDQGDPKDEPIFNQEIRRARTVSRLSRKPALRHIVDTIHFAGSHESIGLQLADACAFFIKRHRAAKPNDEAERFYQLLRPYIYRAKTI
jgi:hypothetical protein